MTGPHQQAYILATTELKSHFGQHPFMTELSSGNSTNHETFYGISFLAMDQDLRDAGTFRITGRAMYTYYSQRLGVDLVKHPENALAPTIAAKIVVSGIKEGVYTGLHVNIENSQGSMHEIVHVE